MTRFTIEIDTSIGNAANFWTYRFREFSGRCSVLHPGTRGPSMRLLEDVPVLTGTDNPGVVRRVVAAYNYGED